jgi:uncharacterized protein involved in response to NO
VARKRLAAAAPQTRPTPGGVAVLAYGFRPFFLLAAVHAGIAMPAWFALLHGVELPAMPLSPLPWHGHELLYGFVMAAVAGFMLTAVPSWTGSRGFAGAPLLALVLLWVAGRIVVSVPTGLPAAWVTCIDIAFPAALAAAVTPPLVRSGNRRNLVFVAVLVLLLAANLRFHLAGRTDLGPLGVALDGVMLLTVIVGGRITPAFTSAWLKRAGVTVAIPHLAWLDGGAVAAAASVLVIDALSPGGAAAGTAAAVAAVLLAARLARWHGHRTLAEPLLWVLHLGYAWLPVALGLKAAALLGAPVPGASWVHALTTGAFSTLILGVMSRATLGHTGRQLRAPPPAVAAYGLVTAAALCRVLGPAAAPAAGAQWLGAAALLWTLAFVLFLTAFAPMLWRARVDGRAG